jgi:dolichol-phosphate mannosyltransferase
MVRLTISIPAYRDASTIEALVWESVQAAERVTEDYEILVINDGSPDDTGRIVQSLLGRIEKLRYHEHPRNLGFGPTIREVYTLPDSEWVYFIPGDAQVPAEGVVELFRHVDHYDFMLAYRRVRQDTAWRKFVSWVYNSLVSLVAGRRVRDVNAAGMLRKRILEGIPLHSRSAFIHAEILLEVLRAGGRVGEIEIPHRPREFGVGSGNKWRVIAATARDLVRYTLCRRLGLPTWGGK